jgi:pyrophosphate--fructose-6-phosphate 1-phosphotransferase
LKQVHPESVLLGFLGGPSGILKNKTMEITADVVASYRNTGGFDMLGSGRTKIESKDDFTKCRETAEKLGLDAIAIIGGDDSNTNGALMAEYFKQTGCGVSVVGVPKTIDGDLKNRFVEMSFGFDTATRLYSEIVANICRDAMSARKYYHFIRLMGRSASHITLEVAFQTHPNVTLVSEEVAFKKQTLWEIVEGVGKVIMTRAEKGLNYGVVILPEGLIEHIPEIKALIWELNHIMADHNNYMASLKGYTEQSEYLIQKLSLDSAYTFMKLPFEVRRQMLMDRDPHGNVQVSRIETERLIIDLLEIYLGEKKADGLYKGDFSYQRHFLGYEGRCVPPTNFDTDYSTALGRCTVALILNKASGYMSVVRNLTSSRSKWEAIGVPLTAMMNMELRNGKNKPVIQKSFIEVDSPAFRYFASHREQWGASDMFKNPGAIQYFGPSHIVDQVPISMMLSAEKAL